MSKLNAADCARQERRLPWLVDERQFVEMTMALNSTRNSNDHLAGQQRYGPRPVAGLLLATLLLLLLGSGGGGMSPARAAGTTTEPKPAPTVDTAPALVLEDIVVGGNSRTSLATILLYLPVSPGERVDQPSLLAAVAALRGAQIFDSVEFYTRPGSQRGQLVLVLEVQEKHVHFRFGTGNTNLDGWYLVPVKLSLDNRLGRAERLDVAWKFGYRHLGLELDFFEPRAGDRRNYWGSRLYARRTDRAYFHQDIEYHHHVVRNGWEVRLGRLFSGTWTGDIGMRFETVEADSFATAAADDELRGVQSGDRLERHELPGDIVGAVGESRSRNAVHIDLRLDSRSRDQVVGSPASGLWGRLKLEQVFQGSTSFPTVNGDLRAYQGIGDACLAVRTRVAAVGNRAAFYDRLYLGGYYTVRGYPGQSLSRSGGDTWLWSASGELRAPLIGERRSPRLAGLLFFDAGSSGFGSEPFFDEVALGTGFGLRLRLAWLGWLGLDFGVPLSAGPYDDAYRLHGSIGWSF